MSKFLSLRSFQVKDIFKFENLRTFQSISYFQVEEAFKLKLLLREGYIKA